MNPLPPEYVVSTLSDLPGWEYRDNALHRELKFTTFAEAMSFMLRAAVGVEKMNHHPEWTNDYNRVVIRLTTHDAGDRVSLQDITLARHLQAMSNDHESVPLLPPFTD